MEFLKSFMAARGEETKRVAESLVRNHLEPDLQKTEDIGILVEMWMGRLGPSAVEKLLGLYAGWHRHKYGNDVDLRRLHQLVQRHHLDEDKPFWTSEEAKRALEFAPQVDDYMHECLLFTLHTGVRPGELFALRWCDVDFERGTILVRRSRRGPTKGGGARFVPMSDRVRELLLKRRSDNDLVFPPRRFDRPWVKLIQIASIPWIAWKDLRGSYATALLEGGVSLKKVSKLLGHKDIRTTANSYWRNRGIDFDTSLLPG